MKKQKKSGTNTIKCTIKSKNILYKPNYLGIPDSSKINLKKVNNERHTIKDNKLDLEAFAHLHLGMLGMYAFVELNNPSQLEMLKQEYGLTEEEAKSVVEQIDKIFKEYEVENER